jgi:hypothetical protein
MGRLHDAKEGGMRQSTHDPVAHPHHRWWPLQEGRVTFSQMICLAILFLVGMQSVKFIASWYDNWRLQEAMQDAVHDASISMDTTVMSTVLTRAKELKIPLDPRNLHLERNSQGRTRLWATYEVTLTFPLGFSRTSRFRPEVRSGRR